MLSRIGVTILITVLLVSGHAALSLPNQQLRLFALVNMSV